VWADDAGLFVPKLLRVAHQLQIGFARIILAVQYKLFRAERLSESHCPDEPAGDQPEQLVFRLEAAVGSSPRLG
jgi:hypothetical protein